MRASDSPWPLFIALVILTATAAESINSTAGHSTLTEEQKQQYFLQNMFCVMGIQKYLKLNKEPLKKAEEMHMRIDFYRKFTAGVYLACLKDFRDPKLLNAFLQLRDKSELKKIWFPFFEQYDIETALFVEDYELTAEERRGYKMYLKTKKVIGDFMQGKVDHAAWADAVQTSKKKTEQEHLGERIGNMEVTFNEDGEDLEIADDSAEQAGGIEKLERKMEQEGLLSNDTDPVGVFDSTDSETELSESSKDISAERVQGDLKIKLVSGVLGLILLACMYLVPKKPPTKPKAD